MFSIRFFTLNFSSPLNLAYLLEFLHYREYEEEREQAKYYEYAPHGLERDIAPKETGD